MELQLEPNPAETKVSVVQKPHTLTEFPSLPFSSVHYCLYQKRNASVNSAPGRLTLNAFVARWVQENPLSPLQVDCATAVMLKILDGKCRMDAEEKRVMTRLYDAVKTHAGVNLGEEIHRLIAEAREDLNEEMKNFIYEKRVLAETMISRPIMKGFKAMIRERGLFTPPQEIIP